MTSISRRGFACAPATALPTRASGEVGANRGSVSATCRLGGDDARVPQGERGPEHIAARARRSVRPRRSGAVGQARLVEPELASKRLRSSPSTGVRARWSLAAGAAGARRGGLPRRVPPRAACARRATAPADRATRKRHLLMRRLGGRRDELAIAHHGLSAAHRRRSRRAPRTRSRSAVRDDRAVTGSASGSPEPPSAQTQAPGRDRSFS